MKVLLEEEISAFSDDELIARIKSGEYEAIRFIISRYMPLILKNASDFSGSGLDSDDLIQEGILAVFSAVKVFDSSKASFSAFVGLCIRRAMNTHLRSSYALKRIPDRLFTSIDDTEIGDSASPEELYIEKESYQSLAESIRLSLSSLEYSVLCEYLSGKSYSLIAKALGISEKSVDNALRRIRKKLGNPRFS